MDQIPLIMMDGQDSTPFQGVLRSSEPQHSHALKPRIVIQTLIIILQSTAQSCQSESSNNIFTISAKELVLGTTDQCFLPVGYSSTHSKPFNVFFRRELCYYFRVRIVGFMPRKSEP